MKLKFYFKNGKKITTNCVATYALKGLHGRINSLELTYYPWAGVFGKILIPSVDLSEIIAIKECLF